MKDEVIHYIKDYLKTAIENNKYSYFLSHKKMKNYKIVDRPIIDFQDCDITSYLKFSDKFNKIVVEFSNKFKKNFAPEYSTLFNKNIKTVRMVDFKLNLIEKIRYVFNTPKGSYDVYLNIIDLIKRTNDEAEIRKIVFHELLHMSSSIDLIFSGFSQEVLTEKGIKEIGNGLNEGYTEYLNRNYFSDYPKYSYHDQVNMAAMIEKIVGKDFMLDCYFKRGLSPLIKKLSEIIGSEGKTLDLILDLDNLLNKPNDVFNSSKYLRTRIDIANIYYSKLNKDLSNDNISVEEYERLKFLYVDRFIKDGITFNDDATIGSSDGYIYILDKYNKKTLNGNILDIKFNLDYSYNKKVVHKN